MKLIDRLILEWSYRTEKGYPDLDNEKDLEVFESMFNINLVTLREARYNFDYLNTEAQKVGKYLIQELGLDDSEIVSHAKNRIIIYTDRARQDVFSSLEKLGYEKGKVTGTSGGGFRTPTGVEIIHKNISSVGLAGLSNEYIVVDKINEHIELSESLDVTFQAGGKKVEYFNVKLAESVGKATAKGQKADVAITDSKGTHAISIKKDGSFRWSSAMGSHKFVFQKVLQPAFEKGTSTLKLVPDEEKKELLRMINPANNQPYGRIHVINAPGMEIEGLAFGTDNAIVVQRTFTDGDFKMEGNKLTIDCTKIMTDVNDFGVEDAPILQFERNASKATKLDGINGRGITLRTVPISVKNKATSKANNLTLDWNDIK